MAEKAFKLAFLAPKYWGIWLLLALVLPYLFICPYEPVLIGRVSLAYALSLGKVEK